MKNTKPLFLLISISILFIAGCKKDYIFEPAPPDPNVPVLFSTEIVPIFEANCYGGGCHDGDMDPDLTPANAYNSLMTGGYVDTTNGGANAESSILYQKLTTDMPPGQLLSSDKIAKILLWIQQGGNNN